MGLIYERAIRPFLFRMDPEKAHDNALMGLKVLGSFGPLRAAMEHYNRLSGVRPIELFGLRFPNAIGLAAGFDKNAVCWRAAAALGFGHVEVGTVTLQKQPGNPRPRIFRIPEAEAVINRYGFPNDGAEAVAKRLAAGPARRHRTIPLGINIGKSKTVSLEQAAEDYLACFNLLADHADYFAINVSSPNTPELRKLQAKDHLQKLLGALYKANRDRARKLGTQPIPLLLKISPDLTFAQIDDILEAVTSLEIDGVIATNTTIDRPEGLRLAEETGGLSGRPLLRKALDVVKYVHLSTSGKLPVIGSGGIVDLEGAGMMMDAGASLVQLYTGLVYRGPFFPRDCARAVAWRHKEWV